MGSIGDLLGSRAGPARRAGGSWTAGATLGAYPTLLIITFSHTYHTHSSLSLTFPLRHTPPLLISPTSTRTLAARCVIAPPADRFLTSHAHLRAVPRCVAARSARPPASRCAHRPYAAASHSLPRCAKTSADLRRQSALGRCVTRATCSLFAAPFSAFPGRCSAASAALSSSRFAPPVSLLLPRSPVFPLSPTLPLSPFALPRFLAAPSSSLFAPPPRLPPSPLPPFPPRSRRFSLPRCECQPPFAFRLVEPARLAGRPHRGRGPVRV